MKHRCRCYFRVNLVHFLEFGDICYRQGPRLSEFLLRDFNTSKFLITIYLFFFYHLKTLIFKKGLLGLLASSNLGFNDGIPKQLAEDTGGN